jgi:hypothetical protein
MLVTENPKDACVLEVLHAQHQPIKNSVEFIEGTKPRFAAASKKPLSAQHRELMLSKQARLDKDTTAVIEFDGDSLKTSINQMIMEANRINERGEEMFEDEDTAAVRQLKVATRRLEEEMTITNKEIEGLEEELDARYMLLEEEAEELDEDEYDNALDFLDSEGVRLENDKLRISELFSIRLKSIREQFQEAKLRAVALKSERKEEAERKEAEARKRRVAQGQQPASADGDDASVISGTSTLITTGSLRGTGRNLKPAPPLDDKTKKKREEGWTLHSRKDFSYNAKLQESMVKSSSALRETWTSPRTKQRRDAQQHKEAVKIAKKIGLDPSNMPRSPVGGAKALLMESSAVGSIDNGSARSVGTYKAGQYYPGSQFTQSLNAKHAHAELETPDAIFEHFKIRLFTRTSVWLQKRGLTRQRVDNDAPKNQEVPFLIQLLATPKPFSNAEDLNLSLKQGKDTNTAISMHLSHEQTALWNAMRIEERDRMAWEETRAQMALDNPGSAEDGEGAESKRDEDDDNINSNGKEKKGVTILSGEVSDTKMLDPDSPEKLSTSALSASGSGGNISSSSQHVHGSSETKDGDAEAYGVADTATALRHCSKGRAFILKDRAAAEYLWSVVVADAPATEASRSRGTPHQSYILRWQALSRPGGTLTEAGNVYLDDLKSVEYVPATENTRMGKQEGSITIQLKSSVRALKSCGGRTKLVLRCTSPATDGKWFMCLKCLWDGKF